jgi:quercetin dioxygenase-like cupin family protein
MRKRLTWVILLSAATVITALYTRKALATPASGFVGTTLGGIPGRFGDIDVFNHFLPPNSEWEEHRRNIWLSWQKTKGASDLYVQSNVWQPGGSTGWHSHAGHSLIFVTEGTVTNYESDAPDCKPTVYTKGMGFVDAGGDHVHNIRNEGAGPASTIAVQLIPAGANRRIDAPQPANCPSL